MGRFKKTIADQFGDAHLCYCGPNDTMWFFKPRDVITRDSDSSAFFWKGEEVTVEGFNNGRLWGTIPRDGYSTFTSNSEGLLLLERVGLGFGVGDAVSSTSSAPKVGLSRKIGKVIAINPSGLHHCFFVRFDDWENGFFDGEKFQDIPWFPWEYKVGVRRDCLWCSSGMIEKIKIPEPGIAA